VSSDVKARVIARVTGIPFIPKKTVEIAENQVVVEKSTQFCKALGNISAPALTSEQITELAKAQDKGFVGGGIVENTEPVTISATVTDHVLPHAVVQKFEALAGTEKQLQATQEETDINDGNFLIDFSQTLSAELDSVLEPDTRVLRFLPDPKLKAIGVAEAKKFAGLPPIGAPDSSEISEQDEHLAEHMARQPNEGREVFSPLKEKRGTVVPHPTLSKRQTVQVSGPTDYETAAELGLSVHAYRWIKRELGQLRPDPKEIIDLITSHMVRASKSV
jgi:hypothetical protein